MGLSHVWLGCAQARVYGWSGVVLDRTWSRAQLVLSTALDASALELSAEVRTWATLEGAPLIVARQVGRGMIATLGFHPSQARDVDGAATALLKHLLISGAASPMAWFDLEGA